MPLSILLPMVGLGIGAIALLLHALGLSRPLRFDDAAAARAAWARAFPDSPAQRTTLSHDRTAALIETADGPGVVWPMGADSAARFVAGARATRRPDGMILHLPDFTAPQIRLHLTPDEADTWRTRLSPAPQPEHPA